MDDTTYYILNIALAILFILTVVVGSKAIYNSHKRQKAKKKVRLYRGASFTVNGKPHTIISTYKNKRATTSAKRNQEWIELQSTE